MYIYAKKTNSLGRISDCENYAISITCIATTGHEVELHFLLYSSNHKLGAQDLRGGTGPGVLPAVTSAISSTGDSVTK
jgi:hypothetical protein